MVFVQHQLFAIEHMWSSRLPCSTHPTTKLHLLFLLATLLLLPKSKTTICRRNRSQTVVA